MTSKLFDHGIIGNTQQALDFITTILQASTEYSIVAQGLLDGTILVWNEGARRLYGYEPEEVIGRANTSIFYPPEDVQSGKPRELRQAALQNSKWEGTFIQVRKSGQRFTARLVMTPCYDAHNQVCGFLLISKDISEEIHLNEALVESQRPMQALFDNTQDAILLADNEMRYIDANPAACTLLGYSREELLQLTILDITSTPNRSFTWQAWQAILIEGQHQSELMVHRQDGSLVEVEFHAVANIVPGLHMLVLRDISERKQTEEALLRSIHQTEVAYQQSVIYARELKGEIVERRLAEEEVRRYAARMEALAEISQALAEAGLDVQAVLDTIVRHTAEVIGDASRITLLSSDEQWFKPVAVHHPKPEAKALMKNLYLTTPLSASSNEWLAHIMQTGQPLLIPIVSPEQITQFIQPEYLPIVEQVGFHSLLLVPLRVQGRVIGTLGLTRDQPGQPYTPADQALLQELADRAALTIQNAQLFEQVQGAHKRLQALSRRLLEVQEAERRHLARELHDEVGQVLTGLKLLLNMSTRTPAEVTRANLNEAQSMVNELMERVGELSLTLRPAMLDDLGLLPTLLWHFEHYTHQTQIRVIFKHKGVEGRRFAPEVETTVYRITQEALTNVARHTQASQVKVRLWADQATLNLEIEDEGTGFDPKAAGASSGLSGMRERVILLKGQLTIESSTESGTSITVELPLHELAEGREVDDDHRSGR